MSPDVEPVLWLDDEDVDFEDEAVEALDDDADEDEAVLLEVVAGDELLGGGVWSELPRPETESDMGPSNVIERPQC